MAGQSMRSISALRSMPSQGGFACARAPRWVASVERVQVPKPDVVIGMMRRGVRADCDNTGHLPPRKSFAPMFYLKKLLAVLILPPLGPLLLVALGLLLRHRRRQLGSAVAWSGLLAGLLLTIPYSVGLLAEPLERATVPDSAAIRQAQAIVIAGGGRYRNAPEYGGDTVNRLTLERLRYGARLARSSGLPILVSGGAPSGGTPEALLMRDALELDFGMRARWTESASRDTGENANFSAKILRGEGVSRVLLVTHAIHMPRAQAEFEANGLQVIPAPVGFVHGRGSSDSFFAELPSANTAYAGWLASHEWLGNLYSTLRRRLEATP